MVLKPLPANADSSIRCDCEFDSNVSDLSDLQGETQDLHNISTHRGTYIVAKRLCAMQIPQFAAISSSIQM
jgi:hypothetical protein